MIKINVAKDFGKTPGTRHIKDGNFSGELFRQNFLEKHFWDTQSDEIIQINLDGTEGYATSFTEEAFGGLARLFGKKRVLSRLRFISKEEPFLIGEIEEMIQHCDEKATV